MSTRQTNLFIALTLVISLSSSNATSRINFEKVAPAPSPTSTPNNTPSNTESIVNSSVGFNRKSDGNGHSPSPSEVRRYTDDNYCVDASQTCRIQEDLFACIRRDDIANFDKWVILVQNVGGTILDVNITVPTSVLIDHFTLKLAKEESRKINISTATGPKNVTIIVNTGKGSCMLQINVKPSLYDWIPAYSAKSTPIYGAYFMLFIIIIVGCIFACYKFSNRKREASDGIPYQQIEMGNQTQSATGIVKERASSGWDESWDNEWDEEESTVGPSSSDNRLRANGNGSSNNIPSKLNNDNKDDWDSDWDV